MKNNFKYIIATVSIIALLIIAYLTFNNVEPVSKTGYYLDTICTITVYDMKEKDANKVIEKGFETCSYYENLLSKTIKTSDISKINGAKGEWVTVDNDTLELINKGVYYSDLSEGTFDITVGRLTDLWDFHAENPKVPKEIDIEDAVKHIGYEIIAIDENEIKLVDPDAKIDLGGIAKGYIADKVSETLEDEGVTSAVVNLGGNIVTIGKKNGENDFVIGIERPYSDMTEVIGTVSVSDSTVVTSGVYERQFEYEGTVYHHILDINTGYPILSDVEAVSLVSNKGMSVDCDALSTICLLLGSEKGMEIIEDTDDMEALFITTTGEYIFSDGFKFNEK